MRVDAFDAPARVTWTVLDSFMPGWPDTRIRFDLEPAGSGCILAFAHRGFAHGDARFARITTDCAYFLVSLKRFVECGRGAPGPEVVDFARMLEP
ncbi:SRPBCC family protein [Metallibacterium sp.]